MGRANGEEVRVFRIGRARDRATVDRVRWGYAVFIPEDSLEQLAGLLQADDPTPEAIAGLLAALPDGAIQGVEAVRLASQRDPQLRRALRDARQALRKGSTDPPPK